MFLHLEKMHIQFVINVGLILGYVFERYVYLDVSLVYAVLMFVGSVAIARFLEKGI